MDGRVDDPLEQLEGVRLHVGLTDALLLPLLKNEIAQECDDANGRHARLRHAPLLEKESLVDL